MTLSNPRRYEILNVASIYNIQYKLQKICMRINFKRYKCIKYLFKNNNTLHIRRSKHPPTDQDLLRMQEYRTVHLAKMLEHILRALSLPSSLTHEEIVIHHLDLQATRPPPSLWSLRLPSSKTVWGGYLWVLSHKAGKPNPACPCRRSGLARSRR